MKNVIFNKITIIGIGLVGASIALKAKKDGVVKKITVTSKTKKTLDKAKKLKLADEYTLNNASAVKNADCVIVCTPVGVVGKIASNIKRNIKKDAVITDVGSVKESVIRQMAPHIPKNAHFIPGHPIAGTEMSGPEAGFDSLFENRWCVLTPLPKTNKTAMKKLTKFWEALGSKIEVMEPMHHDRVLAVTSHIPHMIAYNIVGTASDLEEVTKSEVMKYSAAGFRDFTRIAASDPTMWRDVFLHNKDAVLEILGRFSEDLFRLQRAVRWGNGELLFEYFTRTKSIRSGIIKAGQESPAPNFGRDEIKKTPKSSQKSVRKSSRKSLPKSSRKSVR